MDRDLQQELKKQQISQRRWLIAFALVAFAILILIIIVSLAFIDSEFIMNLQSHNGSVERNYDYLQFVVPVLLAMGAFMAAALGINRLKNLDDQVEKIESRLDKRFELYKGESESAINAAIDSGIDKQAERLFSKLEFETEKSKKELEEITSSNVKKLNDKELTVVGTIDCHYSEIKKRITDANERLNQFNSHYGWLMNSEGEVNPDAVTIESVADAHEMVESLFRKNDLTRSERAKQVRVIVQKILSEELTGDNADYHNLAAELARNELKDLAVQICIRGLDSFQEDVDLIEDIIQFTTQIGEKVAGISIQEYITKLLAIDKKSWTWRGFEFLSDYYIAQRKYNDAEALCNEYIKYLPRDERGYAQLSEIYGYLLAGVDAETEKIKILEQAVSMGFACPRCANSLADLYADRGELEQAIRYSSTAILSLAQDQPSVNYAFVIYKRALYEDRLYLKKKLNGEPDQNLLDNALQDYKDAIDSQKLTVITSNQAKVRYNILANDKPGIKKYSVGGTPFSADILNFLSQMRAEDGDDSEQ